MPGSVDVNSTTQQTQRQESSAAQTLGAFRFGDNNMGQSSGSSGGVGGGTTLLERQMTLIVVGAILLGFYLWKRRP